MRRAVVGLVVALLVVRAGVGIPTHARTTAKEATVERLAGATRYETAAEVAGLLHAGGAATAVVASGTSYADALAAGVAAAALHAPLLLASADHVPSDALTSLGVSDVILIGGTGALPVAVAEEITAATGASVRRIAGANRFDTAAGVAEIVLPSATRSLRVSGESFPSALVAAVHAARTGARLLLDPDLAADTVVVDGTETLTGDPGDLNLALLSRFPPTDDAAVVTTISSFPDALSATALAGALDASVLFTETYSATSESVDALAWFDPATVFVIGGDAAVSGRVLQQLFGFAPLPPAVAPGAEAAIALDVFARINDERARRGVPALRWDPSMAIDAASWATDMSRNGYRHAVLSDAVGENIHMPVGTCVDGVCTLPTSGLVHRDWMRSDGNRDNVLEAGYVIAGVGVSCGPDGTLWAVARFGRGFGPLSAGGTPPDPVAHDDTSGFDCSGRHG